MPTQLGVYPLHLHGETFHHEWEGFLLAHTDNTQTNYWMAHMERPNIVHNGRGQKSL